MKKIPIWKNLVLIISLLVIIVVATFAWFVTGPRGAINGLPQNVREASYIQISGDDGNHWSEDLAVEVGINKQFKEISGDGTRFFAPVYDVVETAEGGYATGLVAFEPVTDSSLYYEQTFVFRADAEYDVYLAPESYVASASVSGRSGIEGAIRVAFFEIDDNNNEILKCVWAPNSTVEYLAASQSFANSGQPEENYFYQLTETPVDGSTLADGATDPNIAKIPAASECGYWEEAKFMWSSGQQLPKNAPALLSVRPAESGAMGQKKMKVRVWLEGHDRECVGLISGEKFTMEFQFIADKGE